MIKPTTNLEETLISNNIFSTKYISSFPFIRKSDNLSYGDYAHFLVRSERFKILLTEDDIKLSEEFKQAIEKALKSMKPFIYLQNVFDEYGHFYPLSIVLGKSLKIISSFSNSSKKIELESPTFESLKSHLDDLNISYLLTQKGNIIEKNDLSNWIQNKNNDLEIIEYDDIISLYNILGVEFQREIDTILNTHDNFKIILTGVVDLKDLDIKNAKHYKRINVEPSLEDENYEVYGSIISKDNKKLEDFFVTFGLYDFNGFFAMISKLELETKINIRECYILWMVIGTPSKLSVFSPKNRELQVDYTKESITLQLNNYYYLIKTSHQLSRGDIISVNAYCSTKNYEPIMIKLVGWSKNYIKFQLAESTIETTSIVDIHICILSSGYKSLKIDNREKECYLDLVGYTLTEFNAIYDDLDMEEDMIISPYMI